MSRIRRYAFLTSREEEVLHFRDVRNCTFLEIARRMGVTEKTMRHSYRNATLKLQDVSAHGGEALSVLPKRMREMIAGYFGGSRAALRAAIETERLHWNSKRKCVCFEGEWLSRFGVKTWRALNEWAGLRRPLVWPRKRAVSPAPRD